MYKENKIKSKSVGAVRIFEIFGQLAGPFADEGKQAMKKSLMSGQRKNILFNLLGLKNIDDAGCRAIYENADAMNKCAFITENTAVKDEIMKRDEKNLLSYFNNEYEAAQYFSEEFVDVSKNMVELKERRQFVRLKTAIPIEIQCEMMDQPLEKFFAVATNLSDTGLFAEFIQSESEDRARKMINPYDLQLLYLKLSFPGTVPLVTRGKVIHGNIDDGGIGIEFYDLNDDHVNRIKCWLVDNIASSSVLPEGGSIESVNGESERL